MIPSASARVTSSERLSQTALLKEVPHSYHIHQLSPYLLQFHPVTGQKAHYIIPAPEIDLFPFILSSILNVTLSHSSLF